MVCTFDIAWLLIKNIDTLTCNNQIHAARRDRRNRQKADRSFLLLFFMIQVLALQSEVNEIQFLKTPCRYVQNTKLTKALLRSSSVTEVILLGISNCIIYFKFFETADFRNVLIIKKKFFWSRPITVLFVENAANGSKSFGVSQIFANYASKRQLGNQETSKAIPRAQLTKHLNEVATITVPSNGFEFWKQRRGEFPC